MNRRDEVPTEDQLLCRYCGYIVSGLPTTGRCPECGQLIADSLADKRRPPLWEQPPAPGQRLFLSTTLQLIFAPARFYSNFTPRGDLARSAKFAAMHHWIAAGLFGLALAIQLRWMLWLSSLALSKREVLAMSAGMIVPLILAAFLSLRLSTYWAVRLTCWEAAYRGFRLPLPVVRRAMHYHAAHYLPVALVAFATVAGFHTLVAAEVISELQGPRYLYILCAEILLAAAYLFRVYWVAMRSLMFAN
jgi:hypothetical protein